MFAGGQVAGMISEILTVEEVINGIITDAVTICRKTGENLEAII